MITSKKVKEIISNVPAAERKMPALVVGGKVYTWEEILTEIDKKSNKSKKILITIDKIVENARKNKTH